MPREILVVDDDEAIRESITEFLESVGYRVTAATNGADAIEQLERMSALPDVILLDLMMPVKDGMAFRDDQRSDVRFADIPVVVMSADPQLANRRAQLAARHYLRKPFDLQQLLAALES